MTLASDGATLRATMAERWEVSSEVSWAIVELDELIDQVGAVEDAIGRRDDAEDTLSRGGADAFIGRLALHDFLPEREWPDQDTWARLAQDWMPDERTFVFVRASGARAELERCADGGDRHALLLVPASPLRRLAMLLGLVRPGPIVLRVGDEIDLPRS